MVCCCRYGYTWICLQGACLCALSIPCSPQMGGGELWVRKLGVVSWWLTEGKVIVLFQIFLFITSIKGLLSDRRPLSMQDTRSVSIQ